MAVNRRTFVESLVTGGTLSGALAYGSFAEALAQFSAGAARNGTNGGNSQAFWSNYYEPAKRGGAKPGADEDRQVSYLHYSSQQQKLRFSHEIAADELYPDPGDVAVTMNVTGMRLSHTDRLKFRSTQSAQLRIDLAQDKPMLNLADKLAWAAVAAVFISEGKMPPLQDMSFAPESTRDMVMPGGTGLLGVNVSMTHRASRFYQILQSVVKEIGRFAPVVGLPAISMTALNEFNRFYGAIEQRTTFLFQTTAPQRVFATRPARDEAQTTAGMNLVSGDYILVPQQDVAGLQPRLAEFKLVSGYLVPKDALEGQSVYQLADNMTPDVSYIAVNLKVTPPWHVGSPAPSPETGGAAKPGGRGEKPLQEPEGSKGGGKRATPKKKPEHPPD